MRDGIAEHSAGKYVGWIVGLQRQSREPDQPSESEGYPAMPTGSRIAVGKDGGDREGRDGVARGKTPAASQNGSAALEPGVRKISMGRNGGWAQTPCRVF